jgi:hypothetical protein
MSVNNRESVITLASRIAVLRENITTLQSELSQSEIDLDRLLGTPSIPVATPAPHSLAAQHFAERESDKSMNLMIVDLLLLNAPRDMDAEDLVAQLPEGTNITSVRSALARLAEQDKISRTARGRYTSIEEAPESPSRIAS